jgi:hypothetical protein
MTALKRLQDDEVFAAAHIVWKDARTADRIADEATRIINFAYSRKVTFFNGKKTKCVVGGLFYLLGYKFEAIKKQRCLASYLETSDVSIRTSYRQWLETFPDLFVDVIGKFAQIKDLRTYVLLSLGNTLSANSHFLERNGGSHCSIV